MNVRDKFLTTLQAQEISTEVLCEKYAKAGETSAQEIYARVAKALAAVEPEGKREATEIEFRSAMEDSGFVPAGRIMSAAGTDLRATLINCFVQPVGDSIAQEENGRPGIYTALTEAAETMRRGGGVGYDFSRIRPRGAWVGSTQSNASGPVSYMRVFDRSCETVESAGSRRGAQMGVLRCDHPGIEDFIHAKDEGDLKNFNISIAVSDEFMNAVTADADFDLVHNARPSEALIADGARQRADGKWVYRTVKARALWEQVMHSTYDHAEPGILYIDRINKENNLWYCETIEATNPCVTADTWVFTEDGPRQVRDLIGQQFTALVDGQAHLTTLAGFFKTGTRPVLKLSTREGYSVRLTADHLILTAGAKGLRQWVAAGDLKAGDRIVVGNHRAVTSWSGAGTEHDGYLLGLLVGDGYLHDGNDTAIISTWDQDGVEAVREAVELAAEEALTLSGAHRGWFPVKGRAEQRFHSRKLRRLASAFGMDEDKGITKEVEQGSSSFYRGFLRGLFDADGSVQGSQAKGVSIRLWQADIELLEAVQRMLARLGIVSTIYRNRRQETFRDMPDGQGGHRAYPIQAQHELVIASDNLARFADVVGFADSAKRSRLAVALAGYKRALNLEQFVATVERLAIDGIEDVYDVQVPGVNAFDANGLYVHNCGEQSLPNYGCCCLGSVDLTKHVHQPFGEAWFDFESFKAAVTTGVRMLDNVLDATFWPLEQQRQEAMNKRRVGLGFLGLGDALIMLGLRYNSVEGRDMAAQIAETMRDAAYMASVELAKEKGSFPKLDVEKYLQSQFALRLPENIRAAIRTHGLRNSHLLSIAPTGTTSLAFADNVSNGIEPAFSWTYQRKKRMADGSFKTYSVEDHAWRVYRHLKGESAPLTAAFVTAMEMTAGDHLRMLEVVQPFIDASISKTVNVAEDYPYDDFKGLYLQGWKAGLKGVATYRPNSVLGSVLSVAAPAPAPAAAPAVEPEDDPLRKLFESRPDGELEGVTSKVEFSGLEGKKSVYLTVNFMRVSGVVNGKQVTIERPVEFFMPAGQRDEGQQWIASNMRLLSMVAGSGGSVAKALENMREVVWDKGPVRCGWLIKADETKAPRFHDSEVAAIGYALQRILAKRGFLDASGNQVPVSVLAERLARRDAEFGLDGGDAEPAVAPADSGHQHVAGTGKKCPDCGAHDLHKVDGCSMCSNCGYVGSCG